MVQHIEQLREDVHAYTAVMLAAIVKDHDRWMHSMATTLRCSIAPDKAHRVHTEPPK